MKYKFAPDLQKISDEICKLIFPHIDVNRVKCYRGYGSSAKGTIARCHGLGKVMQEAIGVRAYYAIELLAEQFDKLDKEEQIKTIIHELMHIPQTFGGGFRHHDHVTEKSVNANYKMYLKFKNARAESQTNL